LIYGENNNTSNYNCQYDANGNMTQGPDFSNLANVAVKSNIIWDAENMPARITHSSSDTILNYDGQGNRIKKTYAGQVTYYVDDLYEETNTGVTRQYIFAGNTRIAMETGNNIYYYHQDHLGSTIRVTDQNRVLQGGPTEYMPFGLERSTSGQTVTNYKFTDQEQDTSTGLYNYDARLYDPGLGMFISPDSIVPDWYDPQSLNRYAYARNNPLIYTDPSGHLFVADDTAGWVIGNLMGWRDDGLVEGVSNNFINSWSAVGGTFNTFENNNNFGDYLSDTTELVGRLTWNAPNEIIGNTASYVAIQLAGAKTERWGDVQLVSIPNSSKGGVSLGSKIVGGDQFLNNPDTAKQVFNRSHEQGHYYDALRFGPLYLGVIGLPSALRSAMWSNDYASGNLRYNTYFDFYTESRANANAGISWPPVKKDGHNQVSGL
jgi:RHS repeat-associated protein